MKNDILDDIIDKEIINIYKRKQMDGRAKQEDKNLSK